MQEKMLMQENFDQGSREYATVHQGGFTIGREH